MYLSEQEYSKDFYTMVPLYYVMLAEQNCSAVNGGAEVQGNQNMLQLWELGQN
jgi:hypothetical protein